jgi:hypothetical protein
MLSCAPPSHPNMQWFTGRCRFWKRRDAVHRFQIVLKHAAATRGVTRLARDVSLQWTRLATCAGGPGNIHLTNFSRICSTASGRPRWISSFATARCRPVLLDFPKDDDVFVIVSSWIPRALTLSKALTNTRTCDLAYQSFQIIRLPMNSAEWKRCSKYPALLAKLSSRERSSRAAARTCADQAAIRIERKDLACP